MTEKPLTQKLMAALRDEGICRAFFCHLRDQNKDKHLTFWLEAEDYKCSNGERDPMKIFETYFYCDSPSYLNMETDEKLEEKVQNKSPDCFEHTQHSSFLHLLGMFDAFEESDIYQEYKVEQSHQGSIRKSKPKRKRFKKMKTGNQQVEKLIKRNCARSSRRSSVVNEINPFWAETDQETLKISPGRDSGRKGKKSNSLNEAARTLNEDQIQDLGNVFSKLLFQEQPKFVNILILTAATCDYSDEMCQAIVDIFIYNGKMKALLSYLFEEDIQKFSGEDKAVLFRTDSPATMIMSKYLNRVAHDFLASIILPITQTLQEQYPDGIEIDPDLVDTDLDVTANVSALISIVTSLLDRVVEFVPRCPRMLKRDLCMIYELVENSFESKGQQVLGSLLFLRFICPAIVSPTRYNLADELPNKPIQRSYILISKLLQNLVNGVNEANEACMKAANSFLNKKNRAKLKQFMISLIEDKTEGHNGFRENMATFASNGDILIKKFILENLNDLWERILEHPSLAVEFFPFFKAGLCVIRPCFASDSIGH